MQGKQNSQRAVFLCSKHDRRVKGAWPVTPMQTDSNRSDTPKMSGGELRETQTANYFSNLYPIDCAVPSMNA